MSAPAVVSSDALPTLELRQFSLSSAGVSWGAPLNLHSRAQRIGLVGDWTPLLQLLTGRTRAVGGSAHVLDCALELAIARGILGFAACDVPLPGSFTVLEYLQHAARLSHGSAKRAAQDTQRALERYGLVELGKRKLAQLVPYQRRALGIALATLTDPPVVCLETPLRDLDAPAANYITRLCGEAATHARVIVSAALPPSPSPERTLLDGCEELFLVKRGTLVAHGPPGQLFAAGTRYAISVKGAQIAEFSRSLSEAGVRLEARARVGSFDVELPRGASSDRLLDAALQHGLIVLELEPLLSS